MAKGIVRNLTGGGKKYVLKTATLERKQTGLHWNDGDNPPTWDVTSYVAKGAKFAIYEASIINPVTKTSNNPVGWRVSVSGNTLRGQLIRTGNEYYNDQTFYITPVAIWMEEE